MTRNPQGSAKSHAANSASYQPGKEGADGAERERAVPRTRESRPSVQTGQVRRATPGSLSSPFAMMRQLQEEVDHLFHDFGFGRPTGIRRVAVPRGQEVGAAPVKSPDVDMFRRGDDLIVRADLPGLTGSDVNVEVEDGILTIRGERKEEAEEDRDGYYWSERSYRSFARSIPLPEGVDEESASASFRDGVLEVKMSTPKEEPRKARKIEVR